MSSLTILLPVYNEDPDLLEQLIASLSKRGWPVVIVDDGSSTPVINREPGVTILRHRINLGQGAALSTGMQYIRMRPPTVVIHMDADGQHALTDIEALARPVLADHADIAIGSRFLDAASVDAIPSGRRWLLRLARWCNIFFTGVSMTDAHNGFRALSPKAVQGLYWHAPGRAHASEIIWRMHQLGLRYIEVPVHIRYDGPKGANRQSVFTWMKLGFSLFLLRIRGYYNPDNKVIGEQQATLERALAVKTMHE